VIGEYKTISAVNCQQENGAGVLAPIPAIPRDSGDHGDFVKPFVVK
jgi:hypothetical protein